MVRLLAMSVAVGLRVMVELMDDEISAVVGPKHAKLADRAAVRPASTAGSVVLGRPQGHRPPIRARTTDGREVQLDSYAIFAGEDPLEQLVFERMLAGLATRPPRGRRTGRRCGGTRGEGDVCVSAVTVLRSRSMG